MSTLAGTSAKGAGLHQMLVGGNDKLGRHIATFGLPAIETCPGLTALCKSLCYANRGRYLTPPVRDRRRRNLEYTTRREFCDRICAEIAAGEYEVVRIHDSGDFYSAEYVRKWCQIAQRNPRVRFYAYTRSWRVPRMSSALRAFSRLRNVRLWLSEDHETGTPVRTSRRQRIAFMQTKSTEVSESADLMFRVHGLRKDIVKRIGGVVVCPPENGITEITCGSCGLCWDAEKDPRRLKSLPLVS